VPASAGPQDSAPGEGTAVLKGHPLESQGDERFGRATTWHFYLFPGTNPAFHYLIKANGIGTISSICPSSRINFLHGAAVDPAQVMGDPR